MQATKRAVIDPLRRCPLRCQFCYYLHGDMESMKSLEQVKKELDFAIQRGNIAIDITGGEPLIWPHIVEFVEYACSKGLGVRIISSLQGKQGVFERLTDIGATWLISLHGWKDTTHDAIVGRKGARARQLEYMSYLKTFDANFVMVKNNQEEIFSFAEWLTYQYNPRVVNFINFNPHYEWAVAKDTSHNIVDLEIAGPQLDEAISHFEDRGVGVNVRYFPYCGVHQRHWKNVCNDLHVMFDSGEWDSGIEKNFEKHFQFGVSLSFHNEENHEPCDNCPIRTACGGANRHWHRMSKECIGYSPLTPQPHAGDPPTFDHFRKQNSLGMIPYHVHQ